jgi:hypothetical protein
MVLSFVSLNLLLFSSMLHNFVNLNPRSDNHPVPPPMRDTIANMPPIAVIIARSSLLL